MTVSFTRTREQLAAMVLRKLRVLAAGATPTANQYTVLYEAIDLRLKEMHRLGVFWRKVTNVPVTFSLSGSIATASAGAGDILFPLNMTFTNGTNDDPIKIIGIHEYAQIEDKTRSGNPTKALWKGGSEFIFYPIPSTSGTAKLTYEKIADDTAASTAPDVEVSMMRWLKDIIAYDVCDDFGQPEDRVARFMRESAAAELNIRRLAVQRVDTLPVAVDDFDSGLGYRYETDYGWRR